jgi:hypothetical protein
MLDKIDFKTINAFHQVQLENKPFAYCIVASEKRVSDTDQEIWRTDKA